MGMRTLLSGVFSKSGRPTASRRDNPDERWLRALTERYLMNATVNKGKQLPAAYAARGRRGRPAYRVGNTRVRFPHESLPGARLRRGGTWHTNCSICSV